jgi:hypothetical protein
MNLTEFFLSFLFAKKDTEVLLLHRDFDLFFFLFFFFFFLDFLFLFFVLLEIVVSETLFIVCFAAFPGSK